MPKLSNKRIREILGSRPIQDSLIADGWNTPDTYANSFKEVPRRAGVYLFLEIVLSPFEIPEDLKCEHVVYVGMSTNLAVRLAGHEVSRFHSEWCQRWFKPVPAEKLRETERKLIQKFQPKLNIIGKQEPLVKRRLAS